MTKKPGESVEDLLAQPSFHDAYALLSKAMAVQTKRGSVQLEIIEVEPFMELNNPKHIEAFERSERQRGEILLTFPRGYPQMHMVVDPEKKSIVWIKKLRLDGKTFNLEDLLREFFGVKRESFKDFGAFTAAVSKLLEGKQLLGEGSDSKLRVEEATQPGSVNDIRRKVAKSTESSLGTFIKR